MPTHIRPRVIACALYLISALAACGQTPTAPTATSDTRTVTTNGDWPACAPRVPAGLFMPTNFAPGFPFPPNLKLFKVAMLHNNPNEAQVVGYTPQTLNDALQWLARELPRAGYEVRNVDAEPGEADAQFVGNGWSGAYWVRDVGNCPGVTEWVVIALKR
ncbi:MAG: hypothetical protein ABI874_06775 [Chloroflexota bacterium]